MRLWLIMLGGLLVWAVHFFALYAVGSIAISGALARIGWASLTAACIAADLVVLVLVIRRSRASKPASFAAWAAGTGTVAALLSIIAVLWQGLPAIVG